MKTRRMRPKTMLSTLGSVSLRVAMLGGAVVVCGSCNAFDTSRGAFVTGTLGDDMYGVFCDRVGASSMPEDLSGDSYQSICHFDGKGNYGDKVDTSVLPPPTTDAAKRARTLSIAKLEAMARNRTDLIQALNAAFPDVKIADPTSPGKTIRMHDALMDFSQKLTPLYESNPFNADGEPLLPASTRALGRLFDALGGHVAPAKGVDKSAAALDAMAAMSGRRGYRPFNVALGAIRPALAYPNLRELTKASLAVLGPTGTASPELQQLLTVSKQEMLHSKPLVSTLPTLKVDEDKAQPNRPRTNGEVIQEMLLHVDKAYALNDADPSRFIAMRDARGFVVPLGNTPGSAGTVHAPFVDADGDGFADVDPLGRFVGQGSQAANIPSPFGIPGVVSDVPSDAYGRPQKQVYQYIDTSRTLLAAVARNLVPLLDADETGGAGADAYQSEYETLMYAMAGANSLYGRREAAQYDYGSDAIKGGAESCPDCVKYTRFRGEDSPLVDLTHAAAQVLADPDSDALLLGVMDLVQNHEQEVARLLGAMLRIREIAAQHDDLADSGQEPRAVLDYQIPIWDEMAQILHRITQRPGLTAKLLAAMAKDDIVTPHETSKHQGDTMAAFMRFRDVFEYDQNNINGPARNETVGGASTDAPSVPVNRNQPLRGDNRSIMQRSFQVIHDAHKAQICNKNGAYLEGQIDVPIFGTIGVEWPTLGADPYTECELLKITNASAFYVDTILPTGHPKKSVMPIDPNTALGELLSIANGSGYNGTIDDLLVGSSGIDGLTQHPSSPAVNRLLFFGADTDFYSSMPDHDFLNDVNSPPHDNNTNNFISSMVIAASPNLCPNDARGVPFCQDKAQTLRVRDYGTMFAWERLGYYDYLEPVVEAFADEACSSEVGSCNTNGCCWQADDGSLRHPDFTGEEIFTDLIEVFWRHWPGQDHGDECNSNGSADTNFAYCSGAGVNHYEPLVADALESDLIPALHEFAIVATQLSTIQVKRGPNAGETWTAAEVLEKMTNILFNQDYARSVGMKDRKGNHTAKWVDGTPQAQLTPFTMMSDALHEIDTTFDQTACSCAGLSGAPLSKCQANANTCAADQQQRKGMWKRARSQLVDQFFSVDGEGENARFRNPATPKALTKIVSVLREQLNANCPDRESGGGCAWAKTEMGDKMAQVLSGPLFAGIMDVQESVRGNEKARREMERLLSFILKEVSQGDAYQSSLAGLGDILQILQDDKRFAPIFNAAALAANPGADKAGAGCADTAINVLDALTDDQFDTYHVMDVILPALVTPVGGKGRSPIEVIMDAIADVDRVDAAQSATPLDVDDYRAVWSTVNGFLTDDTRGLEQFYTIIQSRPRE